MQRLPSWGGAPVNGTKATINTASLAPGTHTIKCYPAERLAEQSAQLQAGAGRARLSLSIGHVTTSTHGHESLQDLLDQADAAMYEHKRGEKPELI